jgi:threonine dehydrogenase-like Zn-dependent dehydrogenase
LTVRALHFDGRSPRFDPRHADPVPGPGEALIRPLLAGVCSTDLEICRGYMNFVGVLGHEFVGIVEAVGEAGGERDRQWIGRRVVGSINCVCGRCDMCRGGLASHCRDRTVLGIAGRDGCFADRFALPLANLHQVPDDLEPDRAVFTEPLAAACEINRQLYIEGKPFITVLGDGRLGLLVAQVMTRHNASVRVIGRHDAKLERCAKWGIKHRLLADLTARKDQDIVVDCTGSADGLRLAMQLVRPRGTIVLKTTVADQKGVDLAPLVIDEIQLIGSRCGPFDEALELLASDQVDVVSMISRRMRLDDGVDALRAAAQDDVVKVLLEIS